MCNTILLVIIAFCLIFALSIYMQPEEKKAKIAREKALEEKRIEREKRRALDEQRKRKEIEKYGHPTKIINSAGRGTYSPLVRVFGKTEFIEISGSKIRFGDIVDYGVHEDITSDLHMSKSSMYGRGLVGGLLYGKVGAIAGVLTAKQYEEISVVYTVYIWLKNGSQRHVRTQDAYYVNELCNQLEFIICQNMDRF